MNPEATAELIWHFAGYLHIVEDYNLSRLKYGEVHYQARTNDYQADRVPDSHMRADLAELKSFQIKVSYSPKYERVEKADAAKSHSDSVEVNPQQLDLEVSLPEAVTPLTTVAASAPAEHIVNIIHHPHTTDGDGGNEPAPAREPVYTMGYTDAQPGTIAEVTQQNVVTDRDYVSDGGVEYSQLHHIDTGAKLPDMIDAAREVVPDLLEQPGMTGDHWTKAVVEHDHAMASGETTGGTVEPGRYVNGEKQAVTPEDPSASVAVEHNPPELPVRPEGDGAPGQVAELGGNEAQNIAVIADINEAPATLIVMGDYYDTNAIYQANVLQNQDQVLDASGLPAEVQGGGNRADNIAAIVSEEIVKQLPASQYNGDLKVNIDFVEGDVRDVKALTQRNFISDGDVTVQTQYDSYSQVLTGGNEQKNGAIFQDWGKHYDIIIVLGDYHSANIILQTNIILDNDIVGVGTSGTDTSGAGAGGSGDVFTGQNTLENDASITKHGATTFVGLTGDIEDLLEALGDRENVDNTAWSSFHGAASGSLSVLVITGDYYDLNVISQVNVIADADLAIQVAEGGVTQWVSTGGNLASNTAEIVDAGGLHQQYLGGSLYEDSVLVQANLVSDASQTTPTDPTALVSELVAFLDHSPDIAPVEGESWTSNTYGNHDTFGHVLT
jgi:hypothetical protein